MDTLGSLIDKSHSYICGIYALYNSINEKCYIGSTNNL